MAARRALALLAVLATLAVAGPWLAPYDPAVAHRNYPHAPPMWPTLSAGFAVHPVVLQDRLRQRFLVDDSRTLPLPWWSDEEPVFLLGADRTGRDVFSRVLTGARTSLGLGLLAVLGVAALGTLLGGLAGFAGGVADEVVMRTADFVLLLPLISIVLVLRAVLPLVLTAGEVFALMLAIFILVGWPVVARGVRGLIARERTLDYVAAAESLGASRRRILWRHLLPACTGHLAVQATLLLPAFILAEATLSFLGLGFPDTQPTWGTMLREAADINELRNYSWTLAPAAAIFLVTLLTNAALVRSDAPKVIPS